MSNAKKWAAIPKCGPYPDQTRRSFVCTAYRRGATIRQIAADLGISHQAVHKLLKAAGMPLRPRGGNTGAHSRHAR